MSDNRSLALVKEGTVTSNETGEVCDMLAYCRLQVQVRVKVAANASQTLQLQHAAIDEDAAFVNLGSAYDIAAVGTYYISYDSFMRYLRVVASGGISTQPPLSVYVIGKEY